jgi:hypothetical protein
MYTHVYVHVSTYTIMYIYRWWTETTHYLHRPTEKLGLFVEAQKRRMQWSHPIIGIHMRLGVDKNREAQRL